jgi:hypothetical protein
MYTSLFDHHTIYACFAARSNLSAKVGQYIDVLKEASVQNYVEEDVKQRLHCLLSSLIIQNIHHRDVMDCEY